MIARTTSSPVIGGDVVDEGLVHLEDVMGSRAGS